MKPASGVTIASFAIFAKRFTCFVLDASPRVLELALGLVGLPFTLHLLVAKEFAGAFLYGITHDMPVATSARRACFLAMKVITQVGARLHHGTKSFWQEA